MTKQWFINQIPITDKQPSSGIYLFYSSGKKLLYIGYASYMKERVQQHLHGSTNTKRFHKRIRSIKYIDFKDFAKACELINIIFNLPIGLTIEDIEHSLIKILNPKYNEKRHRIRILDEEYERMKKESELMKYQELINEL